MIREAAKRALDRPRKITAQWIRDDHPVPPPHYVKQMLVTTFALLNKLDTLVETGTYLGDMIEAQRDYFEQIYSIELSPELAERAKERFRQYPHIEIIQGDSGQRLAEVVSRLNGPALFWLDGQYSAG
jgi:protein-L-isoaspartate O-methyltransferase